mmetsp:Transcript_530/g.1208  ORF Transcript_530/g.1208 Transcript_530/m.1208 type:complete len:196 (+) Transcript_530:195-782(+)
MKVQLLSSAALVLLSAVGAVSEDLSSAVSQPAQSGSGIARAVSGEISVLDYEGEEFSTSPDDPNFTSPDDSSEDIFDEDEEMEEVDHNGGRARAYRKGARRGYNAGHNGRRVNGKERAYARGAVRGYHAGRNGPEYGGGRSRAYRRGAARGYHAGRHCNGKCDGESEKSYDSYDQYPEDFDSEDVDEEDVMVATK